SRTVAPDAVKAWMNTPPTAGVRTAPAPAAPGTGTSDSAAGGPIVGSIGSGRSSAGRSSWSRSPPPRSLRLPPELAAGGTGVETTRVAPATGVVSEEAGAAGAAVEPALPDTGAAGAESAGEAAGVPGAVSVSAPTTAPVTEA